MLEHEDTLRPLSERPALAATVASAKFLGSPLNNTVLTHPHSTRSSWFHTSTQHALILVPLTCIGWSRSAQHCCAVATSYMSIPNAYTSTWPSGRHRGRGVCMGGVAKREG
eukprot:364605-Chlamydomonas_euryale.AAC.8